MREIHLSTRPFRAMSSAIVLLPFGCWTCVGAAMAQGPSFDCGQVEAGSIEAMICKDSDWATRRPSAARVTSLR
jgi:hypothetical protein